MITSAAINVLTSFATAPTMLPMRAKAEPIMKNHLRPKMSRIRISEIRTGADFSRTGKLADQQEEHRSTSKIGQWYPIDVGIWTDICVDLAQNGSNKTIPWGNTMVSAILSL